MPPKVAISAGLPCPWRCQISQPTAIIFRLPGISRGGSIDDRARAHQQNINAAVKLERRRAAGRFWHGSHLDFTITIYRPSTTVRHQSVPGSQGWDGQVLPPVSSTPQEDSTTSEAIEPLRPLTFTALPIQSLPYVLGTVHTYAQYSRSLQAKDPTLSTIPRGIWQSHKDYYHPILCPTQKRGDQARSERFIPRIAF